MTVPPAAEGGGSRGSLPSTLDFSNRDEVGFHYKGWMVDGEYTPTHGFDHPEWLTRCSGQAKCTGKV